MEFAKKLLYTDQFGWMTTFRHEGQSFYRSRFGAILTTLLFTVCAAFSLNLIINK
jgi:hypothetical protein